MAAKKSSERRRPKTSAAQRREAVRLLRILAERETEPGAKGYAEGAAEAIENGGAVSEPYIEGLRRAVAGDSDDEPAAGPTQGGQ